MGGCVSTASSDDPYSRQAKARSDEIDKAIDEDFKKFKKECKILLLGSGESGKSTIVKQMKIIHQDGFSKDELMSYRPVVYRNVLDSAQAIVLAMKKLAIECADYSNRPLAETILDYKLDESTNHALTPSIAEAISKLWSDPVIPKIMDEHSSEFYLMDSASYFFSNVLRIGDPHYIPTETDVLRARAKTTSITETRFSLGPLGIHMFDVGGQRSERKKWIHCFESVTSIIFCTALSEYDQGLLEANGQNRMTESLTLFESVINSRWFLRTSIILFLNKIDVFKVKLPKVPLERYFPEYTGGRDINKAAKFILWKFMQANRARLSVYPHLTQATDTGNIRLVFAAVKETILQNALKDSGIL
ncbi:heterotrimeric G-protein alpha subunit, GPA3-like protein [Fistulina hepatica ATCC 64428]|uniref:Guanine nucleotide-binding protein subunit alpha n=1 Tax=Fistulina hepatica ATCC 64428 TaxID=1128425 RepID=A0A0D7AM70_9AGAR|nr:heterotrimeric G-protein alpha subunit, GPA3-like protein [Fistulina hepatica ATCC 64428]